MQPGGVPSDEIWEFIDILKLQYNLDLVPVEVEKKKKKKQSKKAIPSASPSSSSLSSSSSSSSSSSAMDVANTPKVKERPALDLAFVVAIKRREFHLDVARRLVADISPDRIRKAFDTEFVKSPIYSILGSWRYHWGPQDVAHDIPALEWLHEELGFPLDDVEPSTGTTLVALALREHISSEVILYLINHGAPFDLETTDASKNTLLLAIKSHSSSAALFDRLLTTPSIREILIKTKFPTRKINSIYQNFPSLSFLEC